jgi:hypothetical protein
MPPVGVEPTISVSERPQTWSCYCWWYTDLPTYFKALTLGLVDGQTEEATSVVCISSAVIIFLFGLHKFLNIFWSMCIDNEFRSCHVCVHAGLSVCVPEAQKHMTLQNYLHIHGQAASSRSNSKAELLKGNIYIYHLPQ